MQQKYSYSYIFVAFFKINLSRIFFVFIMRQRVIITRDTLFLNCRNRALENINTETINLPRLTKLRHPNNALRNSSNELLYHSSKEETVMNRISKLSTKLSEKRLNTITNLCRTLPANKVPKHKSQTHIFSDIISSLANETYVFQRQY